jgi:hypothetical protein
MEGLFKWETVGSETENPAWDADTDTTQRIHLEIRHEFNPATDQLSLVVDDFTRDALEDCVAG